MQEALASCTEEESERERPKLRQAIQELLSDFVHNEWPALSLDDILIDAVKLNKIVHHLDGKGERKKDDAGGKSLHDLHLDQARFDCQCGATAAWTWMQSSEVPSCLCRCCSQGLRLTARYVWHWHVTCNIRNTASKTVSCCG